MKVHIQGKGSVVLTPNDFKAKGGEGSVYVKGQTAFKIYDDSKKMIPFAKIQELSALTHPDIIRPQDILVDDSGKPVGYSMRYVKDAFPLCRMFPKAFRVREGLTPEKSARLVQLLRDGVQHVHNSGILVVDLNELNFLIDSGFANIYFIDTDSYQTPHFPAAAIMDCIRDRHAPDGMFSVETDWFSFAVVSFMMFVGIHPFKGKHPKLADLDSRMKANISVLNPDVSVPPVCLPFDVIPPAYRSWYERVLEMGERSEPPAKVEGGVVLIVPKISQATSGSAVNVSELLSVPGQVVSYYDGITVTDTHVTNGRMSVERPEYPIHIVKLPVSGKHLLVWLEGRRIKVLRFDSVKDLLVNEMVGDAMASVDGRVYIKSGTCLYEMKLTEMSERVVVSFQQVGNVSEHAAYVFDGVVINDLPGSYHAAILPETGRCYNVRLEELGGYRLIDGKYQNNVLIVIGHREGRYDRFVFRFGRSFRDYDVRIVKDIPYTGLNFTVLDTGVCVLVNEKDEMELSSNAMGSCDIKVVKDPAVDGQMHLFKNGAQLIGARGDRLYRLSMR